MHLNGKIKLQQLVPVDYILILLNSSFHSADILQMRNDTERKGSIRESENNYTKAQQLTSKARSI